MSDDELHDDELLALLAAAVDADLGEVPEGLSEFARAARLWAVFDEELAELVETEAAAVRSTGFVASAVFDVSAHEIVVGVRGDVLVGEVSPGGEGIRVEVETLESVQTVDVDDLGRFRATGVELPFRVRLDSPELDRRIVTPWVTH
jgi:hypothetical protein